MQQRKWIQTSQTLSLQLCLLLFFANWNSFFCAFILRAKWYQRCFLNFVESSCRRWGHSRGHRRLFWQKETNFAEQNLHFLNQFLYSVEVSFIRIIFASLASAFSFFLFKPFENQNEDERWGGDNTINLDLDIRHNWWHHKVTYSQIFVTSKAVPLLMRNVSTRIPSRTCTTVM